MVIYKYYLAYLCNDIENSDNYSVNGDRCYYKNEYIGDLKIENENFMFRPIKSVKSITVNLTIDKENNIKYGH